MSKKYIYLFFSLLLLCVFGITHQLQLWGAVSDKGFQFTDAQSYLEAAENLYLHQQAQLMRPYGYPILLGLPYCIGLTPSIYWGVFLNICLWFATLFLLYKIIKKGTNSAWAAISTGLFVLNIGNIALVFQLLSETLFTFCLVLFAFFIQKYSLENKDKYLIFAAFTLSFSALVRVINFNIWFIFAGISIFFVLKNNKIGLKERFYTVFGISSAALLLLAQMAMMQHTFGVFTLTFSDKLTFYGYLGTTAEGRKGEGTEKLRNIRGKIQRQMIDNKQYQALYQLGVEDIKEQFVHNLPNLFAAWKDNYIENTNGECLVIQTLFSDTEKTEERAVFSFFMRISKIQNQIYSHIILLLFAITFFVFYKKIKTTASLLLAIVSTIGVYCIVLSGVSFWQGDRFLVPLVPFALIGVACVGNILKNQLLVNRSD